MVKGNRQFFFRQRLMQTLNLQVKRSQIALVFSNNVKKIHPPLFFKQRTAFLQPQNTAPSLSSHRTLDSSSDILRLAIFRIFNLIKNVRADINNALQISTVVFFKKAPPNGSNAQIEAKHFLFVSPILRFRRHELLLLLIFHIFASFGKRCYCTNVVVGTTVWSKFLGLGINPWNRKVPCGVEKKHLGCFFSF